MGRKLTGDNTKDASVSHFPADSGNVHYLRHPHALADSGKFRPPHELMRDAMGDIKAVCPINPVAPCGMQLMRLVKNAKVDSIREDLSVWFRFHAAHHGGTCAHVKHKS